MRVILRTGPMRLALAGMTALLMSGCVTSTGSATSEAERSICRELRRDLPTYSMADTTETKEDGAAFLTTFYAVCGR